LASESKSRAALPEGEPKAVQVPDIAELGRQVSAVAQPSVQEE